MRHVVDCVLRSGGIPNIRGRKGGERDVEPTTFVTIGSAAPDFRAPTSNGQTLDRASFLGKVPVALVFPELDARDLAATLTPFDERMVEFGHRRVQVLVVVDESPRTVRELAERIPLRALTLLADPDGSIREAFAPAGGQCDLIDTSGTLRAVVPLGPDAVDELLRHADALAPAGAPSRGTD
jgi:peroxiredoxin